MSTNPLHEQKCPGCGAAMRFDPGQGKLVCDYCGTVLDISPAASPSGADPSQTGSRPSGGASAQTGSHPSGGASSQEEDAFSNIHGFDFNALTDQVSVPNAENLPVYVCVSCGAELIVPPSQTSLTCPYCGNNIVLTNQVSGMLRPDGVIPFTITPDKLPSAVNRFYKGKKLLPKRFFSESTMGKVTGVYVPFWVFSGNLNGTLMYYGTKTSSHKRGNYIITDTDEYLLTRRASLSFDGLPVDTSGRIDDALMDSLQPFDLAKAVPFDMRYLAGFTADRFDQKKSEIAARAEMRMRNTAASVVSSQAGAGYSHVRQSGGSLSAGLDARYLLFPVYLFDISHNGKNYPFAVNGQTGKVVGSLPISQETSLTYFLKHFGSVAGLLIGYSVIKYFLGG